MAITAFFVDALSGALDLGLATPDDVLKHVTPDVLAANLPRALWAKLLRACLDAPRVDAALVVKTIGIPDLCACVPGTILWSIVADIATRALGKGLVASPPPPAVAVAATATVAAAVPVTASGPVAAPVPVPVSVSGPVSGPVAVSGSGPAFIRPATSPGTKLPDLKPSTPTPVPVSAPSRAPTITTTQTAAPRADAMVVDIDFEDDEPAPLEAPPARTAAPTPVPRVTQPGAGGNGGSRPSSGAGASSRRPQANAGRPGSRTSPPSPRRGTAGSDFDLDTDVSNAGKDVPVEDEQLIDWTSSEETQTSDPGPVRKR